MNKIGADDYLVEHGADGFRELKRIPLKHAAFTKQREWYPTWKASRTSPAANDARMGQGTALTLKDPEPWPESVDGAQLLDEIAAVHGRYVMLPKEPEARKGCRGCAADAAALWDVHTFSIDAFQVSPILELKSAAKRCGKTTHLDVHRALVRRPLGASNITAAALFRSVESFTPTLLIDEADTFLAEREELRGILNAGHTRSTAQVVRSVGEEHEVRVFNTFCPKAFALIGDAPGTIEDRAIIIRMERRKKDEKVQRLRRDRIHAELEPLRRKAMRWAMDHMGTLRDADPEVPTTLNDRAADNWRPLFAIADAAGGDWPDRARAAARFLSGVDATEDSDVGVQLLGDIRDIFDTLKVDKLSSEGIVERLSKLENRPWPEWRKGKPLTPTGLARLLKPYKIRPKQIWVNGGNVHGYERIDFANAWERYLPAADGADETLDPLEPAPDKAETHFSQPLDGHSPSGSKNGGNACGTSILAPLAFQDSGNGEQQDLGTEEIEV